MDDLKRAGEQRSAGAGKNFSLARLRARSFAPVLLIALGIFSLVPYLYAFSLQDLRADTVEFELAFFAAFVLYALAVILILRNNDSAASPITDHWSLITIFGFAILFNAIFVFTPPTLSDDMYRYVWDGRVQSQQINPYAYAPSAPQLQNLRDSNIWLQINRKDSVTVYPAGAELAFAAIWRVVPDNVRWFQVVMAAGNIFAGTLLVFLLRALGKPDHWVVIFLWHPLVIFETAHAAHLDGLVLPLLIAAWLARAKGRDGWVGVFLGAAAAMKLYPALLLPALWNRRQKKFWQMPLTFAVTFALAYVPYLTQGAQVVGFLPEYFNERFNMGIAGIMTTFLNQIVSPTDGSPQRIINLVMLGALVIISLVFILRPARNAEHAIRRCIWLMGAFTLLNQNLFPWYMVWLVPLLALFVHPIRFNAWTGWFLFSGLVALAYTFFIQWQPVSWALWLEFTPLYVFLILPFALNLFRHSRSRSSLRKAHAC